MLTLSRHSARGKGSRGTQGGHSPERGECRELQALFLGRAEGGDHGGTEPAFGVISAEIRGWCGGRHDGNNNSSVCQPSCCFVSQHLGARSVGLEFVGEDSATGRVRCVSPGRTAVSSQVPTEGRGALLPGFPFQPLAPNSQAGDGPDSVGDSCSCSLVQRAASAWGRPWFCGSRVSRQPLRWETCSSEHPPCCGDSGRTPAWGQAGETVPALGASFWGFRNGAFFLGDNGHRAQVPNHSPRTVPNSSF